MKLTGTTTFGSLDVTLTGAGGTTLISGGVRSRTSIVRLSVPVPLNTSVAVHVSAVAPSGNTLPDGNARVAPALVQTTRRSPLTMLAPGRRDAGRRALPQPLVLQQ